MKNKIIVLGLIVLVCPVLAKHTVVRHNRHAHIQRRAVVIRAAAHVAARHAQRRQVKRHTPKRQIKIGARHIVAPKVRRNHNRRVVRRVQPRIIAPAPIFVAPAPVVMPVLAQAPVAIPAPALAPVVVPAPVQEGQECPICGEEGDMLRLACGHQTCRDCLQHMLANAVQEHSTRSLRCSDPDCRQPFSPADIAQITDDQALLNNISDLFFQEFVAQDPSLRHCPTVDCPYMYSYEGDPQQVTCPACHQNYCSNCLVNHPVGVACGQAEPQNHGAVVDHAAEEAATEQLLHNTTKPCPRCHSAIEKNEGCNHMTCSHCHHEFCWLCLIPWPGIGGHACPLYGAAELADAVAHDGQFAAQVAGGDQQDDDWFAVPAPVYGVPAYGWNDGGPRGLFNAW